MYFPFSETLCVSTSLIEELSDLVYLRTNSVEEIAQHINKRLNKCKTGDVIEEIVAPKNGCD
jgi:hypothetical protein